MHDDQADVTAEIVATLIREQFPQWSGKAIRPVSSTGTVHAIFRIGNDLSVRFPLRLADAAEALAVLEGEAQASAELAQVSRFSAPEPVALGKLGAGYPMPWSVQTWLSGTVAFDADPSGFHRGPCDLHRSPAGRRDTGAAFQRRGSWRRSRAARRLDGQVLPAVADRSTRFWPAKANPTTLAPWVGRPVTHDAELSSVRHCRAPGDGGG
ncbi:phosphotransferase [Streptomyces sp. NBC_01104]|uniref:phosphotransferase n=1 Tax=Streptomyces sp. NBC_01104 TaxID=2903750 RepID=UPI00386D1A06